MSLKSAAAMALAALLTAGAARATKHREADQKQRFEFHRSPPCLASLVARPSIHPKNHRVKEISASRCR